MFSWFLEAFAQPCERNFGGIARGKAASESTAFFTLLDG